MKPQDIRVYKMMSSSLWENKSVKIQPKAEAEAGIGQIRNEIQPEPAETVNIEMEPENESDSESMQPLIQIKQEIKDEEIQTVENDPSKNYDEDVLEIRVICEKIVRKLLAGGKKYCSNCYDIFENSDGLSAHLANATANGNCSQDYSEQGPVDILNGCKVNIAASASFTSSASSSALPSASTEPAARIIPSSISVLFLSSGMNNNKNNNIKIAGPLYKCPFCPVSAQTLAEHDKHILIHIAGSPRAYTCTLCPPPSSSSDDNDDTEGFFKTVHDWFWHVKTCHVKEKRGRGRPIKTSTKAKAKVNETPSIFPCSVAGCEKVFESAHTFKHHMEVHEGKLVEYSCQFPGCPDAKTKKNWGNLKQFKLHMVCHRNQPSKTVQGHSSSMRWLCAVPDCFRNFRGAKIYMGHVIHHRERPFICPVCQMGGFGGDFQERHKLLHNINMPSSAAKTVVRKRGRPRKIANSMEF